MATYLGRIQLLAKLPTDWAANDAVLLNGEIGASNVGSMLPILKIGDGVRPWSQLPNLMAPVDAANDYIAGPVTTLPAGSAATVTIDNTVDPPTISFGIPRGNTGPPNTLTIGTVTTGAPGAAAAASITGVSPNQILNLTLPQGQTGPTGPTGSTGPAGPPNTLTIGTVTTGAPGAAAAASITGTSPNQILNLSLPQGQQGPQGIQGPQGVPGSAALAQPSKLIGLTVKNGSGGFAMYADAAHALDQAIAPTWTGAHTFTVSRTTGVEGALKISAAHPCIVFQETDAAVDTRRWLLNADGAHFSGYVLNDADSAGVRWIDVARTGIAVTSIALGNTTDYPSLTMWSGDAAIQSATASRTLLQIRNSQAGASAYTSLRLANDAARTLEIDYASSTYGGGIMVGAPAGECAGICTTSAYPLALGTSNTARLWISSGGTVFITGELGVAGPHLYMSSANRIAMSDAADGYLRLNNFSHYASGIYTPGVLRASGGLIADAALGNVGFANRIAWGTPPGGAYGTCYVNGATNSYHGLAIYDGTLNPVFMSNGSEYGIYSQPDQKWLILRQGSSAHIQWPLNVWNGVSTYHTVTAGAFNVASSRKIKRETGTPSRVAETLAKLRIVLYRLLEGDTAEQLGMISEEVHAACPWLSRDGKSIAYDRLALLLLADWQARHAREPLTYQLEG